MIANLHIHSRFSDGTQWPKDIVNRATDITFNIKTKLDIIALTDHDTLSGNPEFLERCEQVGIKGIAGVEIDCIGSFIVANNKETIISYESEILGYFPNNKYSHTQKLLKSVIKQRKKKFKSYIKRASKVFSEPNLNWKDFRKYHSDPNRKKLRFTYMKPHLYYYLKERKVKLIDELEYPEFKNIFFNPKNPLSLLKKRKSNKSKRLSFERVVKVILKDNGYAVIPHLALRFIPKDIRTDPLRIKEELILNTPKYNAFLDYCHEIGVWGIEMYCYLEWRHQPEIIDYLNDYIRTLTNNRFKITWGSDCHGIGHRSDTMENFFGNFEGFS